MKDGKKKEKMRSQQHNRHLKLGVPICNQDSEGAQVRVGNKQREGEKSDRQFLFPKKRK